jgi:hypothetical protein
MWGRSGVTSMASGNAPVDMTIKRRHIWNSELNSRMDNFFGSYPENPVEQLSQFLWTGTPGETTLSRVELLFTAMSTTALLLAITGIMSLASHATNIFWRFSSSGVRFNYVSRLAFVK